jgi:hypothetical protein
MKITRGRNEMWSALAVNTFTADRCRRNNPPRSLLYFILLLPAYGERANICEPGAAVHLGSGRSHYSSSGQN